MMATINIPVLLLLIVNPSCLPCSYHNPPQIMSNLTHQQILSPGPNRSLVLECLAEGEPLPSYQWFRNHLPIPGEHVDTSVGVSKLVVSHTGYYHCQAGNSLGLAKSDVVEVLHGMERRERGAALPTWIVAPQAVVGRVGSRVVLRCEAGGVPEPSREWSKNGEVIEGEINKRLTIDNLSESDVANYACNASNSAGYVYKNVIVNLLTEGAKIIRGPQNNQIVSEGSIVTIPCEAEGFPRPMISWRINGTKVEDSDKYKVDTDTGALTIMHANTTDSGSYDCKARNHEEDQASENLIVKSWPTIMDWPKDQNVVVFSSVLMNCSVVAKITQNITVMWKKNDMDLGLAGFPKRELINTDGNYALRIKNVTFDDSGVYTCIAETTASQATASALLTIRRNTKVVSLPIQYQLEEGEDMIFNCEAGVDEVLQDPLKINWYKEEERLNVSYAHYNQTKPHLTMLLNTSLLISGAQYSDLGHYSCEVVTSLQPGVRSYQGEIFTQEPQLLPLVIILVAILAIITLLISICITCHRMGNYVVYRVKTTDKHSITKNVNRFPKTKIPMKQFSNIHAPICSIGSIEELLVSEMGEDGSFRGLYTA